MAGQKCQALDMNGKLCRKGPTKAVNYHGDQEIYNYFNGRPVWVRTYLCKAHQK